jgi:hypothetical protein
MSAENVRYDREWAVKDLQRVAAALRLAELVAELREGGHLDALDNANLCLIDDLLEAVEE